MDEKPLLPHSINFLRMVNLDLLNQLVEHPGRELAGAGVFAYQRAVLFFPFRSPLVH